MKNIRRISAILLALVMVLALTVNAFAYTVTIEPNADDNAAHTYEAYQIFKGDLAESNNKKILSNITWGSNVDDTKLGQLAADIEALRDPTAENYTALTASSSAAEFAEAIAALNAGNDTETAQKVADAFGKVLTGTPAASGSAALDVSPAGYYLVKDQDNSLSGQEDAAYSRFILQVVSDVTVAAKSEVPSVDKKIKDGETKLSANSASIGDEIPYEITSKVPDMTGYDKYYFVLNDTMSKGLTFNDDVTVTIGETALAADDYEVSYETAADGTTAVKIVLKNFIQYKDQKDAAIAVNYTATLNEQADLTAAGNVNEVQLTYSNDPNYDYQGTDEPDPNDPDEPTGVTPKVETKTFSIAMQLTKVDADIPTKTLTGAKFLIDGEKLNVALINEKVFEPAADGTYYMLKDGTYTTEAPNGNEDLYDSTSKKYKLVDKVTEDVTKEQVTAEGYVNENGVLTIEGLNAGTYTITELAAPEGYNLLKQPIELVVNSVVDQDTKTCDWSATVDGENAAIENNVIKLTVKNNQGSELPSTGGIGTTLFYVLGGMLVLSACVILITRKRVNAEA